MYGGSKLVPQVEMNQPVSEILSSECTDEKVSNTLIDMG